ncbi:hypothetical protein GCM10008986_16620 [Salinibacillus aidingensis]|uniref:DUF4868 domain-containing protein n=1 Tax=Salinibacillus aidingensis TaxID=237684 RepID=A0ABP3L350_9BACI
MDINNDNHIVKKLIALKEEDYERVAVSAYFVCKDNKKNDYYFSKSVELDDSITNFLKEHIIKKISEFMDAENNFAVQNYNQEFKLTGYIGRFNTKSYSHSNKAVTNFELLRKALIDDELEKIQISNFQIITLTLEDEQVSFCFYRSVKKQAKTKKIAIWSSEEFKAVSKDLVEFGGNFSFFMDDKNIYIVDPRHFEWAFDYKDHITEKSRINMERLTSMSFFSDDTTKEAFRNASNHHLLVRGIASMDENIISEVEEHFNDRVDELKKIRDKRENIKDEDKLKRFKSEIGELDDLINYIDFDNKKVIFKENDNPTPLLHFFQDKIVESFLTKRIKVAMSLG